jgi:hypothetical protein
MRGFARDSFEQFAMIIRVEVIDPLDFVIVRGWVVVPVAIEY